jgi:galactonate dehydratase
MKITELELFSILPRWLFLKVSTDEGISGWGEPIVEGRAETVRAAVDELSDLLIGKDPRRIEDLFQIMHKGGFYRGGAVFSSAISGIEQALWDIKGKALNVPIYELLGGAVRDKIRVYAHIGADTPEELARVARERVALGYTALKIVVPAQADYFEHPKIVDDAVAMIASLRAAVGNEIRIGIDFHGRVHRGLAKVMARALEEFSPMFYEELVLAEHNDALRDVASQCSVPLATGERIYTRWGFRDVLASGIFDLIQPDVSHCGGIFEMRKIAAMAEAYDVAVAPHCPLGPITLAASLQVDYCTPNAIIQEQVLNVHDYGLDTTNYVLAGQPVFKAGFLERSELPGLGITINEEKVREAAKIGHRWRNPILRGEDGSFQEW